jgi:hypothetical protein
MPQKYTFKIVEVIKFMLNYYFLKSSHVKVLRRVGGTDKRTS